MSIASKPGEGFRLETLSPLFSALKEDPSPEVRTLALQTLTSLPLHRETWYELKSIVSEWLSREDAAGGIPRVTLIDSAAAIPLTSMRRELHRLLLSKFPEERFCTAYTLACVRDAAALPCLLELLEQPDEDERITAAEHISLLDVSGQKEKVEKWCGPGNNGDVRFWLSLAMARLGEPNHLQEVMSGLKDGSIRLRTASGDPGALADQIKRRAPVGDSAAGFFDLFILHRPSPYWEAVAQALKKKETEPPSPTFTPPLSSAGIEARNKAGKIAEQYKIHLPFTDSPVLPRAHIDILRHLNPAHTPGLVTLLFQKAVQNPDPVFRLSAGNSIMQLLNRLRNPFSPGVDDLFRVYMSLADSKHSLGHQLAWTIARGGLEKVVPALAACLESPRDNERLCAARLLRKTAMYASLDYGPEFGGAPAVEESPVPTTSLEQCNRVNRMITLKPKMYGVGINIKELFRLLLKKKIKREPEDEILPEPANKDDFEVCHVEPEPPNYDDFENIEKESNGKDLIDRILSNEGSKRDAVSKESGTEETTRSSDTIRRVKKIEEKRVVNTGFIPRGETEPLPKKMPLACGKGYYFWLDVEKWTKKSIEETPEDVPREFLPERAPLKVVLFTYEGGIRLSEGTGNTGEMVLAEDGGIRVTRQPYPADLAPTPADAAAVERRMFFPVETPEEEGTYLLRCNIYFRGVLVQSRLICARVSSRPAPGAKPALRSILDYSLTHSLRGWDVDKDLPDHFSLQLDRAGGRTHLFCFAGETDFAEGAEIDTHLLQNLISDARGGLRKVAWGDKEPWTDGKKYRYDGPKNPLRLKEDLAYLAIKGYRLYDLFLENLDVDPDVLGQKMERSGFIQIALKQSGRHLLPAAVIYDYPLDSGLALGEYRLCHTFSQSVEDKETRLEDTPCFRGKCPERKELNVVCPGGFWGYRHRLGLPISIGKKGMDVRTAIYYTGSPLLVAGVYRDFKLLKEHHRELNKMSRRFSWEYSRGDRRDRIMELLKEERPQVVYFYCHGGLTPAKMPYLKVGTDGDREILRDQIRSMGIRWKQDRPLVFINGCHTAALEPEQASNFVGAFVRTAHASGVIGTEITIFESLARDFAEAFMKCFMQGQPLGHAVRGARLALLKKGNPLGLVYIPFAPTDLRVVKQSEF